MINVIKDVDLSEHLNEYDAIIIGVNLYYQMANGIQLYVMLNYPYAYDKNMETKYGDKTKLGTIIEAAKEGEPTFCLAFICEGNFRPDLKKDYLSYEALENALRLINIRYKGKKIACPLLGGSRFDGNGDKNKIMEIFNKSITNVDMTIYDYFQKSRDEEKAEIYYKEQAVKAVDRKKYYEMVRERKQKEKEIFEKNGHRRH